MHYTVYLRGLFDKSIPVEVDYDQMMDKLSDGETLTEAETTLLEQLQPELLNRYFQQLRTSFPSCPNIK